MSAVAPLLAPAPTIAVATEFDRLGAKLTVGLPTGATALTVWRVATATGNLAYIRGWQGTATTASSLSIFDWEVPLGVAVTYYATATVAGVESDVGIGTPSPFTVMDDRDWLVDLARPTNTFPVLVESLPALDYGGPVGVHRVLDRRDPVLTTAALWTPSATLSITTETREERDRARAILGAGVAFLLRTPPERGVGNLYLGVTGLREQRISRIAQAYDRRFVAEVVQVARPDPHVYVPLPPLTYADRQATWPLYQDATATGSSYQDLAYTFPPGRVDPSLPWPPDDV